MCATRGVAGKLFKPRHTMIEERNLGVIHVRGCMAEYAPLSALFLTSWKWGYQYYNFFVNPKFIFRHVPS